MLRRKLLGFFQRFARHNGHLDHRAIATPVKYQIIHGIGRPPLQRLFDLIAPLRIGRARCLNLIIQNLAAGDHQFGRKPCRRQAKCGFAQIGQRLAQIGGVDGGISHLQPAPRGAVQQADAVMGQVQGEVWFHCMGLT